MITKILASVLIVMIIVLQYNVWFSAKGKKQIDQLEAKITLQQEQNELLINQNRELKKEVELLRNQPEVLEEKAREQLGLVKEDEIFYRVIPPDQE